MWNQVGPQPIAISELDAYLRVVGVKSEEEKAKYLRLIRLMDDVELNYQFAKRKQEAEKAKATR